MKVVPGTPASHVPAWAELLLVGASEASLGRCTATVIAVRTVFSLVAQDAGFAASVDAKMTQIESMYCETNFFQPERETCGLIKKNVGQVNALANVFLFDSAFVECSPVESGNCFGVAWRRDDFGVAGFNLF